MTDSQTLIAALRAEGHDEQADAIRDKALADELRSAGHEQAAQMLEGQQSAQPTPAQEDPHAQLLHEIQDRNAEQWTSTDIDGTGR